MFSPTYSNLRRRTVIENKTMFHQIRPLCINVAKQCEIHHIKALENFINDVVMKEADSLEWISSLDYLKEYIAFPLVLHLKNYTFGKGRQTLLEAILSCLKKVLAIAHDVEWTFFCDVFTVLFKHLSSYDDPAKLGFINEECKMEALLCVKHLCKALDSQYWQKLCTDSFRPQLGHAIFICLQIVEKEKDRVLKVIALETVQSIGMKDQSIIDVSTKNKLSSVFANFLPGITIGTTRAASSEETQGHKVPLAAIQCWEYFVVLVLRDQFLLLHEPELGVSKIYNNLLQKLCPAEFNNEAISTNSVQTKLDTRIFSMDEVEKAPNAPKLKSVTIDMEWITATANHLKTLMMSLISVVSHSHSRVRLTMISCAKNILFYCPRSLSNCMIICLEILVTLSNDPATDVCKEAREALHHFKQNLNDENLKNISNLLEERIFYIISRFPTLIKTQSDEKSLASLRLIYGFLEFLGKEGVSNFLQTSIHSQRLLQSLVVLFTYDISDSDLLLERMISEDPLDLMSVKPGLGSSFRYFQSSSIFDCASACCYLLGSQFRLLNVVDQCLELAQESSIYRVQAYLVLSLIMKGASQNSDDLNLSIQEKEIIVQSIFDLIFDTLKLFDVPLKISEFKTDVSESCATLNALLPFQSTKSSISIDLAKRNVILVSNLLKITGYCALFLQANFKVFLSGILCSVLEKAGDPNVLVSHSACMALRFITSACQYSNISEMIAASVPLFWFNLSQKLKRLNEYPSSPLVLKFALKCNKEDIAPFVEDLVDDVLDCLDSFHSESCIPLLTVLFVFVDALVENKKTVKHSECGEKSVSRKVNDNETLLQYIWKLNENEKVLEQELNLQNEKDLIEAEKLQEEEGLQECWEQKMKEDEANKLVEEVHEPKKKIPRHIELLVQILERCSYLLFTKDRRTQLLILEIIKSSPDILNDWEDEKLPAYHKIWKPLVLRLKDQDFVVLLKALEVCVVLVKTSGTFLKKRCLQELFPSIIFFLKSQSHASLNQLPKTGYHHTPAFKAQRHSLENLPALIEGLELNVLETLDLLEAIVLYLDDRQPNCFVEHSIQILSIIKKNHPDLLWFALCFLRGELIIKSPSEILPTLTVKGKKLLNLHCDIWKIYEDLS